MNTQIKAVIKYRGSKEDIIRKKNIELSKNDLSQVESRFGGINESFWLDLAEQEQHLDHVHHNNFFTRNNIVTLKQNDSDSWTRFMRTNDIEKVIILSQHINKVEEK